MLRCVVSESHGSAASTGLSPSNAARISGSTGSRRVESILVVAYIIHNIFTRCVSMPGRLPVLPWLVVLLGSPSRAGDVRVYVPDINQPSLPSPFYSVLVSASVFMALSTVFYSINSPDNSPFPHSVLPVLSLTGPFSYASLCESLRQP